MKLEYFDIVLKTNLYAKILNFRFIDNQIIFMYCFEDMENSTKFDK